MHGESNRRQHNLATRAQEEVIAWNGIQSKGSVGMPAPFLHHGGLNYWILTTGKGGDRARNPGDAAAIKRLMGGEVGLQCGQKQLH